MKVLEPQMLALVGYEAQSTTELIKRLYGEDYPHIEGARVQVHEALAALEGDGLITSRMCYSGMSRHNARYWALPGGRFPSESPVTPLTERVLGALSDGPLMIEAIYSKVYSDEERTDQLNSEKRLYKALNRLKSKGLIERTPSTPSTWRLTDEL